MHSFKSAMKELASAGWLRWIITGAILIVAAVLTFRNKKIISEGLEALGRADLWWVFIAIVAIGLSIFSMAEVMCLMFRAAGVRVNRRMTNGLTLAANAWSVTVPGGVAFSTALQFRRQLQWGATAVVISWYMAISAALSFLGLVFLGLGSLMLIGREGAQWVLISVGLAVSLVTYFLWRISQNPSVLEKIALWALRVFNKLRRSDETRDAVAVRKVVGQLTSVDVPPYLLGIAFFWSLMNWVTDVVCLYACVRAIGVDEVSLTMVLLAFVTGKLAGLIQATPGGVGPVEAVLTGTLVAAGLTGGQAFAAILIYRIVSFVLVAVVGWTIYLLQFDHAEETADESGVETTGQDASESDVSESSENS